MAKKKRVSRSRTAGGRTRKTTKRKTSARKSPSKRKTAAKKATRKKSATKRGRAASSAGDRTRPTYSEEFRREVAEHSILNGIHSSARKYKVSAPSVTNWRRALGITRQTKKAAQQGRGVAIGDFSVASRGRRSGHAEEFRREVAEFSILNGIQRAAKKFKVSAPTVTNWRRKFGINRATKAEAIRSMGQPGTGKTVRPAELRAVRRQLDQAFKALDKLLTRI